MNRPRGDAWAAAYEKWLFDLLLYNTEKPLTEYFKERDNYWVEESDSTKPEN